VINTIKLPQQEKGLEQEGKKIKVIFKLVTFLLTHIGQNPILTRGIGIHSDDVMVKSCKFNMSGGLGTIPRELMFPAHK
jgi:hypothetical protein